MSKHKNTFRGMNKFDTKFYENHVEQTDTNNKYDSDDDNQIAMAKIKSILQTTNSVPQQTNCVSHSTTKQNDNICTDCWNILTPTDGCLTIYANIHADETQQTICNTCIKVFYKKYLVPNLKFCYLCTNNIITNENKQIFCKKCDLTLNFNTYLYMCINHYDKILDADDRQTAIEHCYKCNNILYSNNKNDLYRINCKNDLFCIHCKYKSNVNTYIVNCMLHKLNLK